MKRKEDSTDDNQALKDGRLPNDQPDSNVQQQPTTVHFMQVNAWCDLRKKYIYEEIQFNLPRIFCSL